MHFRARQGFPIFAVLALLIFAACGGQATPAPSKSVVSPQPTASPTPTEEPEPELPVTPKWAQIQQVDPAGVDHLDTFTLSDNESRIHIVVPQLTGHDEFNDSLQQWAATQEEEFLSEYVPADTDNSQQIAAPSLTASWTPTAISPHIVGFYLESVESPGASVATKRKVVWYDPTEGNLVDWQDLLTAQAHEELEGEVRAALAEKEVDFDSESLTDAIANGDLVLGFTAGGDLFVGFDSYAITAGYLGAPGLAIPIVDDAAWLTEKGQAARNASIEPETADIPEAPVAPEPPEQEEATVDCSKEKCVALTFDDGPSSKNTPKLLDILAKEEVPATFFVLGTQAKAFPEIVARAAEEGHEIGSHTWKHANLTSLSAKALKKDLGDTNKAIKAAIGTNPHLMRPPYGATDSDVAKVAKDADLALIMWDIDTLDWQHRDKKKTVKNAGDAKAGSIVLMHDIHETTVEAAPKVIKKLREEGFTFVTVSQLLGETKPGESYFRAAAKN